MLYQRNIDKANKLLKKSLLKIRSGIIRFFCSKILGHRVNIGYTDNGYLVCGRCGMHEYYDANFHSMPLFFIPKRIKWWLVEKYRKHTRSISDDEVLPF